MPLPSSRKDKDLPPALHSMWRALKRGYEAEPRLLSVSFGLSLLAALPDALLALWIKLLADGVIRHNRTLAIGAAIGLAVSAVATWFIRVTSDRTQRRFRDRVAVALESAGNVARSGFRARPHVHVVLLHLRVDPATGRDSGFAHLHSSCAGTVSIVRTTHSAHLHMAPRS